MAVSGETMRSILATRSRIDRIRTPMLEALADDNVGALGQSMTGAWMELREAFVRLEETFRSVTPQGAPYDPMTPKAKAEDAAG